MKTPSSVALLLALSGCFYVDDGRFAREVADADGDGGIGVRFGGPDCKDDDTSVADCDADHDGYLTVDAGGDDCDDTNADVVPGTFWFRDLDGDGYGDPDDSTTGCGGAPAGWSLSDRDCDDTSAASSPNAVETCDADDRDCDGDPIANASDASVKVWPDADGDSFGDDRAVPFFVCEGAGGVALRPGDCDDAVAATSPDAAEVPYDGVDQDCDASNEFDADLDGADDRAHGGTDCDDSRDDVRPGAPEVCDGLDNDCDDLVDADDPSQPPEQLVAFFADVDGDGFGGATSATFCAGSAPDGYVLDTSDCDDGSDAVFPGAVEWCNGRDDDCNAVPDDGGAVDAFTAYVDDDDDGFGAQGLTTCGLTQGLVLRGGDCLDDDPDAYPGAPEVCGDPVRQDCSAFHPDDCDNDGYQANATTSRDCDDDPSAGGARVSPGEVEICDGTDNDCDGNIDAADPDLLPSEWPDWYLDLDGDGYGAGATVASNTCSPPPLTSPSDADCDDLDALVYPEAPERCDALDNDCDALVDELAVDPVLQFEDRDGDSYGSTFAELRCPGDAGFAAVSGDCDDDDASITPAADEVCDDLVDNDCDTLVDAADPSAEANALWFPDDDKDGLGLAPGVLACADPSDGASSFVSEAGDCDDSNPAEAAQTLWFADLDQDAYGGTRSIQYGCKPLGDWYPFADDCNDAEATVHPNQRDGCNLRDDDCDGIFDDDPPPGDTKAQPYYDDLDLDGFGALTAVGSFCLAEPPGSVQTSGDCDDDDPSLSPGELEVYEDGLDNDCDASTLDCAGWQWPDLDGDGRGDIAGTPMYSCPPIGATAPDDCDDTIKSPAGNVLDLTPADAGDLATLVQAGTCTVLRLAEGTYPTSTLVPIAGARLAIVSADPARPAVLESTGAEVFALTVAGAQVDLANLTITGFASSAYVRVTDSELALTNVYIDGRSFAPGVNALGGSVALRGVRTLNTYTTADGSALFVDPAAELIVDGLEVAYAGSSNGLMHSLSIGVGTVPRLLERVTLKNSRPIAFTGGSLGVTSTLRDLQSWQSNGPGVKLVGPTNLIVERALIVRSGGNGIRVDATGGALTVSHTTIARTALSSILNSSTTSGVVVEDSLLVDVTTGNAFQSASQPSTHARSYVPSAGLNVSPPGSTANRPAFVSYHRAMPSTATSLPGVELWDLHLTAASPWHGTSLLGDDAGYYPSSDPYYDDTNSDLVFDGWEARWFVSPYDPSDDPDLDGLTNQAEFAAGTCPRLADTDNDLFNDAIDSTAPLDPTVHP